MAKYQEYFKTMLTQHKELFDDFKQIHDKYTKDPKTWQQEFNEKGQEILRTIRRYENMLCSKSESGKYGKFSPKLADKFWEAIRTLFPKIDSIGML